MIDLKEGNLVEIVLTKDARLYSDMIDYYAQDAEHGTNISGRRYSGYVAQVGSDSIIVSMGWNPSINNYPERLDRRNLRFCFDAIDTCVKQNERVILPK